MRFRLRINHERTNRTAKGECRHVWRTRDVHFRPVRGHL